MVAGMSAIVYYVLPGLLGRAYDMKNNSVGPDLFSIEDTNNAKVIEKYMTTCEYKVVSELSEATDFLDINGKLALGLKTGNAKLEGTGTYLKDTTSFKNRVDILVKVHFETVIKSIPAEISPRKDWYETIKKSANSHYIRSILYGGDLIASIQFTAKNDEDKEVIKATVSGEMNSESGSFGGGLKGGLEKVKEKIGETANMEINYYATVPLVKEISRDLEGLIRIVDEFPEATKAVNNGLGVPLMMEVFSLQALNKNMTTVYQTMALQDQMVVLDEQFSDIKNTRDRLSDWLQTLPPNLPEEQNKKIGDFASKLDSIHRVFCQTIANLDLSDEGNAEQFGPAFVAYLGEREEAIPNMWVKDLTKLKKEVLDGTPSLEGDYGGAHYTQWGSEKCPDGTTSVFQGIMSTTNRDNIAASQYTCLPEKQQFPNFTEPNHDEDYDIENDPQVQQVAFVSRKQGAGTKHQTIKCASCRVPGKSTTTMLTAQTQCPAGWTKLYKGTLVSTEYQTIRGGLACLDVSRPFEEVSKSLDFDQLTVITEVSPKCGNYPCSEGLSDTTSLPCVVCSITKKMESFTDTLRL